MDPGKNLTGFLESERRIYGSPEAISPAKVFRFSLSKMTLPAILSHLENLSDFRKTVEAGVDLHLGRRNCTQATTGICTRK